MLQRAAAGCLPACLRACTANAGGLPAHVHGAQGAATRVPPYRQEVGELRQAKVQRVMVFEQHQPVEGLSVLEQVGSSHRIRPLEAAPHVLGGAGRGGHVGARHLGGQGTCVCTWACMRKC